MNLKEIILKAEEKKALAYEKYQKQDLTISGAMEYYMDITSAFFELLEAVKRLDLPDSIERVYAVHQHSRGAIQESMDTQAYHKKVRELSQEIEQYKIHAKREIENNEVCHPSKVRDNSQRYLEVCKQRYKDFTGEEYNK